MGSSNNNSNDGLLQELKDLVLKANEKADAGDLVAAKNLYLDAAELALNKSKTLDNEKKTTFSQLARYLVDQAGDLKLQIEIAKSPLPRAKGVTTQVDEEHYSLHQLIIMSNAGLPFFNYMFTQVEDKTQAKLNEILFSGAITAINQLMQEVVSKPIQQISFEEGTLLFKINSTFTLVLYSSQSSTVLVDKLTKFSKNLDYTMHDELLSSIKQGKDLSNNGKIHELVTQYFR